MTAPDALEARVSTARAAGFLGVSRRHVHALIAHGKLDAWDVRLPGARRARFAVLVSSLRVFLAERHRNTRTEDARAPAVADGRARAAGNSRA